MVIRDQKQDLEEKLDAVINDPVNHPSHYTSSKIEVIEYILDHGLITCSVTWSSISAVPG